MAKRVKKVILSGITNEQFESAMTNYAIADAEILKITAAMDVQFTKVREKYASQLETLTKEKNESFDMVQAYAIENRETLFVKKKSLENTHGVLGFRIGTPKLKTAKGFTWISILPLIKKVAPTYVRTSEDIDKARLLADRESEETAQIMNECGILVAQDESFYIELKKEVDI